MFLFKKQQPKNKDQKEKDKIDDDCPMCHIPQEVVDQLKKKDCCQGEKKEISDCCKK